MMGEDTKRYVDSLRKRYPEHAAIASGNFQGAGEIVSNRMDARLVEEAGRMITAKPKTDAEIRERIKLLEGDVADPNNGSDYKKSCKAWITALKWSLGEYEL
jgi:hypothetical protein